MPTKKEKECEEKDLFSVSRKSENLGLNESSLWPEKTTWLITPINSLKTKEWKQIKLIKWSWFLFVKIKRHNGSITKKP